MGLAALFVLVGAGDLYFAAPTAALTPWHLLGLVGGWTLAWGGGYGLLRARLPQGDLLLLPPVALLTGWGLLLLARLAPGFLVRQVVWLLLGMAALCATALWPRLPRFLHRYRYSLLGGGLLLLSTTLIFGVNPSGQGARLWLGARGLYFQPSELLKLLAVSYLASYLADRREVLEERGPYLWPAILGPLLLMIGLALVLLAWQEDLGAALLFYLTALAMLYLAWGKPAHVALGLLLFAPVAVAGAQLSSRVALRVSIWLNPWAPEQADRAFQILQSLFALAGGGLVGEGLGQGRPTLIPAVHTDFVYAALVNEFGLVGALGLLAVLAFLVQRGFRLAQISKSPFESFLAGGIAALLGIQTFVIIAGNAKLIPITGVTLPFLSYGGSSLVTLMMAVGLLLNLSAPHPLPLSLSLPHARAIVPLRRTSGRLGMVLLALLAGAAVGTGSWTVMRAAELRSYPTNPNRILAELRIRRGRIVDRRNTPLADIHITEDGFVERTYPLPEAAPVVGYATLEYGTGGIEATCDAALRGDVGRTPWQATWDGLLHRESQGHTVALTLDARLQQMAQQLLAGQRGAVVLVDAHTGEVLALASAPTYDPASVAGLWDSLRDDPNAPLLNRATQSLVQPGASLETIVLSAMLQETEPLPPAAPFTAPVAVNGASLTCRVTPAGDTWDAVFAAACPAPFAEAGATLGAARLQDAFAAWGLTAAPDFELPTVAAEWNAAQADAAQEAIGQGGLLVTPLQMAGVVATLGNAGVRPPLHLLAQAQPGCAGPPFPSPMPVIEPELAAQLRSQWPTWGDAIGHLGTALAGPERELSWFLGLNSEHVSRYAVVVLLENPPHVEDAAAIGVRLLRETVAPCSRDFYIAQDPRRCPRPVGLRATESPTTSEIRLLRESVSLCSRDFKSCKLHGDKSPTTSEVRLLQESVFPCSRDFYIVQDPRRYLQTRLRSSTRNCYQFFTSHSDKGLTNRHF